MGELWDIAQRHMDAYGVRGAALARRMGVSPQALSSWKLRDLRQLPDRDHLEALARETRTPYGDVLTAALRDAGYLDARGREERADRSAPTKPAVSATAAPSDDMTEARLAQARERYRGDMERAANRKGASQEMVALEQRDVTERFMKRVQDILAVDLGQQEGGSYRDAR